MNESKNNVSEAYKLVVDYNKVIISLSSTILAGQIAFLVFQETPFIWTNYLSSLILVITIIFALSGFGKSILTIKTERTNRQAILYTNLSVYALILGITLIAIIQPKQNKSLSQVLNDISTNTSPLEKGLIPKNCKKIVMAEDKYTLEYISESGDKSVKVIYSIKKDKIISIE